VSPPEGCLEEKVSPTTRAYPSETSWSPLRRQCHPGCVRCRACAPVRIPGPPLRGRSGRSPIQQEASIRPARPTTQAAASEGDWRFPRSRRVRHLPWSQSTQKPRNLNYLPQPVAMSAKTRQNRRHGSVPTSARCAVLELLPVRNARSRKNGLVARTLPSSSPDRSPARGLVIKLTWSIRASFGVSPLGSRPGIGS
jgi:hypothetical protein